MFSLRPLHGRHYSSQRPVQFVSVTQQIIKFAHVLFILSCVHELSIAINLIEKL